MKNENFRMTRIREKIRKNWENIKSFIGWEDYIAVFAIIFGLVGYIPGPIPFIPFLTDFYFDMRSNLVALGLTVLIIDNVNEMYRRRAEKERLILQMGSPDNGFALEAVRQLAARKWLYDGSLQRANLTEANLSKAILNSALLEWADLSSAHLEAANLMKTHLEGANLKFTHLENANLGGAHLEGSFLFWAHLERADLDSVHLERANLIHSHLEGSNLKRASITNEQLSSANLSQETIMPDGSKYDGRFDKTIVNDKK